jgi:hypothetical protein
MPQLSYVLNVSAMLRALADVADQHPCLNPDFSARSEWDLLQSFNGGQQTMAVQFSGDFVANEPGFRVALGRAYRKHGGHPELFLSGPELEAVHADA